MANLDPAVGTGPAAVLGELALEQAHQGLKVTVLTVDPPSEQAWVQPLRRGGVTVHMTGPGRGPLRKSAASTDVLRRVFAEGTDLVHVHGLWLSLPHRGVLEARRACVPYIFSAHGMLEPWALRKGRLKKMAYLALGGRRDLKRAAAIHATASMEAKNIARLGLGNPVFVTPIGVRIEQYIDTPRPQVVDAKWPALAGKRRLLFMGRIDPVKGTVNLAKAWGRIASTFPDWRLVIAGADWHGHKAEFEAALTEHGGRGTTEFLGPVYGEDKSALLASCDLMVQPSFQENFGITIAESLASGRPVITTKGTPWRLLETAGLGWWIDVGADPLERALRDAMSRPREDLDTMGRKGRALVEERFTWPMVTRHMTAVYSWLLGRSGPPLGVYLPGSTIPA